MIETKWKIFAIGQCFSNVFPSTQAAADMYDALVACTDSAEVYELLCSDEDVVRWYPYEYMSGSEFMVHVEALAHHAQQVAAQGDPK